jgi:tRNA (guanine10-N2)-methyltransferase
MKSTRKQLEKYNLKKRLYLGPTSTCAELAFLMANQALLKSGDVVYDPFVGTGSLSVACAHFNAYTIGSDIDWRVLHGQTRAAKSDIFGNFKQYGLSRPELVCSDQTHPVWRIVTCDDDEEEKNPSIMRFDAIVCDPPYGVRAGARKSGTARRDAKPVLPEHMGDHVPASQVYDVEDVMIDLLDFSAVTLKLNGRLVYLLPTTPDFTRETLPSHPCMEIHSVSEQILRANFSRLLVTMVKVRPFSNVLKATRRNRTENTDAPSFGRMKEVLLAPPKSPQHARKNQEKGLCKYFKAGKCTMGERCKWSHTMLCESDDQNL